MTPYRIRSQSVSERLRRSAPAGGLAIELISRSQNKPHYPAEITGLAGPVLVARGDAIEHLRRLLCHKCGCGDPDFAAEQDGFELSTQVLPLTRLIAYP